MEQGQVLIVTPFSELGKLVGDSLTKAMPCKANSVSTIQALAQFIYNSGNLDHVMLDLEMGIEKIQECVFIIRDKFPLIDMILMCRKDPPDETEYLRPWRLLKKPFVENELLSLFPIPGMREASFAPEGTTARVEKEVPSWIMEKDGIKETILSSIQNLDVKEAILFLDDSVLVHTNSVQVNEINDCSRIIHTYLTESGNGEVIKQIRLNSTNYLLHGTILAVGIVLALLYNPETPFRTIRSQSRYLVARIINPKLTATESLSLPADQEEKKQDLIIKDAILERHEKLDEVREWVLHPRPARKFQRKFNSEPQSGNAVEGWVPSNPNLEDGIDMFSKADIEIDRGELHAILDTVPENDVKQQASPRYQHGQAAVLSNGGESEHGDFIEINGFQPSPESKKIFEPFEKEENFLPDSLCLSQLDYACLLIPRIKTQALTGDLARFLSEEVPSIFLARGWRLDDLRIDKLFMEWLVRIPSNAAPSDHINIIRKESSRMVLGNFSRLTKGGLITDFWAPGFLLETGKKPIAQEVVINFIQKNRQLHYPDGRTYRIPDPNPYLIRR